MAIPALETNLAGNLLPGASDAVSGGAGILGSIAKLSTPLGLVSAGLSLAGLLGGSSAPKVNVSQQVSQVQAFSYVGGDNPGTAVNQNPSTSLSNSTNQEDRTGVPVTGGLNGTGSALNLLPTSASVTGETDYTIWLLLGAAAIAAFFLLKKRS